MVMKKLRKEEELTSSGTAWYFCGLRLTSEFSRCIRLDVSSNLPRAAAREQFATAQKTEIKLIHCQKVQSNANFEKERLKRTDHNADQFTAHCRTEQTTVQKYIVTSGSGQSCPIQIQIQGNNKRRNRLNTTFCTHLW